MMIQQMSTCCTAFSHAMFFKKVVETTKTPVANTTYMLQPSLGSPSQPVATSSTATEKSISPHMSKSNKENTNQVLNYLSFFEYY